MWELEKGFRQGKRKKGKKKRRKKVQIIEIWIDRHRERELEGKGRQHQEYEVSRPTGPLGLGGLFVEHTRVESGTMSRRIPFIRRKNV